MRLARMLAVLLAGSGTVVTSQSASVNLVAKSDVYFSSAEKTDQVVASVKGSMCDDAIFELSVRHGSTALFHRSWPLFAPPTCEWFKRDRDQAIRSLTNMVNQFVGPVRAADYTCPEVRRNVCKESPVLEQLRRANAPLLCFSIGIEAGACVGFDPKTKTVIEVWSYSE